jgi:hypothetical protein
MHRASLAIIAIPLILLAATGAISSTVSEDAYARDGRYSGDSTSQAASVSNDCFNPIFDSNEEIDNAVGVGNCGGTVSQQDESGSASAPITFQTANPTIELQRATTTQPPLTGTPLPTAAGCEQCFSLLSSAQQQQFEGLLSREFTVAPDVDTIDQLCALLVQLFPGNPTQIGEAASQVEDILLELQAGGTLSPTLHSVLNSCLNRLFPGIFLG